MKLRNILTVPRLCNLLKLLIANMLFPFFLYAQSGNGKNNAINVGNFEACSMRNYSDLRSNSGYGNNYDNSYYPHPDGQPSPDVWYTFTVSDNADMQISTCGSGFDTYIHLLDPSGYLITGNDNANCGLASTITYTGLSSGTYYVVVEGKGNLTGSYTLNIGKLSSNCPPPPLGDKMSNPIVFNTFGTCGGSVSDSRWSSDAAFTNDYGQPSSDIFYQITLSSAMDITVSHCGSNIDTYVTILNSAGGYVAHNDDNYSSACPGTRAYLQVTLPAGTYYVVSEGYGYTTGLIVTTVTASTLSPSPGANMSNAINAGTFSGPGIFTDSRSNADPCLGNNYGQPSNDIFYKFTLTDVLPVRISHCGSGFDTYMHLLNSTGELISFNDNNTDSPCPGNQAYLQRVLPAGTYYVVSEGAWQYTGTIVTGIEVLSKDCPPLSAGASSDQNYIITYSPNLPVTHTSELKWALACQVQKTVEYYDGLGRPLQRVQQQASPGRDKDIIQPVAYDQFGREAKKYLPYASNSASAAGSYRVNALGEAVYYYQGQPSGMAVAFNTPYAQTVFDSSPLNRVQEQGAPGNAWQPLTSGLSNAGHTVKIEYSTNIGSDDVRNWDLGYAGGAYGAVTYSKGELFKTVTKNENWLSGKAGTSEDFKDKQGQLVLKKEWETETVSLNTYYLYDDKGNLVYVLPPGATKYYGTTTPPWFSESDDAFNNLIYAYRYDYRDRVIEKKIPGKGWEYFIYNKMDQLVASQDAEQRKNNQWLVKKYDAFGRVVMTGVTTATRAVAESGVDGQSAQWESRIASGTGYTTTCWPGSLDEILSLNYYDSYDFPDNTYGLPSNSHYVYTQGLLTGSKVKVLGTSTLLLSVNYYDSKGRVVQNKSDNHLGGTDIENLTYSFTDQVLSKTRIHTVNGQTTTIVTTQSYDHMGRKIQSTESINGATPVILSKLTYSETGQLMDKEVHSTDGGVSYLNKSSYTYNPRNWLKSQTNTQAGFNMALSYEDGTIPQYNGSISNQNYTNGASSNTFVYQYDKLDRLFSAVASGMSEVLSYDEMGNIKTLNRDNTDANVYSYIGSIGNQLQSVANVTSTNYVYDANGNATTDGKNGKIISYNYLNLPQTVSGGLTYTYDATGVKLRKNNNGQIRDYVKGIEYQGGNIEIILTEEGVARRNGSTYSYEYNVKDHLGNVRATFYKHPTTGDLDILQRDNYYAFGKRAVVNGGTNLYLYNGKEIQEELGGQYDYGARFYDPVIGRFTTIDNLAEEMRSHSPYNYGLNNPLRFTDPDGNAPTDIILLGANNSSVTIETELIDIKVNASSLGLDFGGNYNLAGDDIVQAGLDIVGIVDPTGIADGLNASLSASKGDWLSAGISALGVIPYAGDLAKAGKIEKDVKIIGNAIEAVNGNSKASTKAQHVYEIYKTGKNGAEEVVKTGVSGGKVSKAGESYRATSQANKWNKAEGAGTYKTRIKENIPAGKGARQKALDAEKANAKRLQEEGHLRDPKKHVTPR